MNQTRDISGRDNPRDDKGASPSPSQAPRSPGGGEDDASTEIEGDDSHLHEDQKAPSLNNPT